MMKNRELIKYCDYCDSEYTALRVDSKYCSASCRQMASKSRLKGGAGVRQNLNSLPRSERFAPIQEAKPKSIVNYVSTQSSVDQHNRQPTINQSSKNVEQTTTIRQPIVNEAVEKIKMEIELLKYKAELNKKAEADEAERQKKQLIQDLQTLLEWNTKKKGFLSRLKLITNSIAEIVRTQKDIFKQNPENYDFFVLEFIPKLKNCVRDAKKENKFVFEFTISVYLVERINKVINHLNPS